MAREQPNGAAIWLRSLTFFVLYNLMGIVHSLVCLLVAPFQSHEQRYWFVNLWTRATMWLLRTLNGIEIRVEGRENLPQGEAMVVAANHQSEWETFYLQLLVAPQATVLKRELLRVPFFGWGLALLRPISIDRGNPASAMKKVLREGQTRLNEGVSVVIYPEGARQQPGEVGRFGIGAALLACRSGHRVIPIAHNAGDCWPYGSLMKYPGTIVVRVGEPMSCPDNDPKALNTRLEAWIRDHCHQGAEN